MEPQCCPQDPHSLVIQSVGPVGAAVKGLLFDEVTGQMASRYGGDPGGPDLIRRALKSKQGTVSGWQQPSEGLEELGERGFSVPLLEREGAMRLGTQVASLGS